MARTVRNQKIDSRSARAKLAERREPYWTVISAGCAIGYRRGGKGGTWIARFRNKLGRQHYDALGAADDAREPDGLTVFSFGQAQERARAYFDRIARKESGNDESVAELFSLSRALGEYFAARERRGSKGVQADRFAANARIVPDLGAIEIQKLTTRRIRDWHESLAGSPKLVRAKSFATQRATKALDVGDPEAVRARRSTANRILTILKAALNHAFQEGRIGSDEAWRKVKPFREVDAPVVRFLTGDECRRIVNGCEAPFRDLVRGALLTGCRYGELTRMRAGDFNAQAGTVTIRMSKAGKARHVTLNDEGRQLFSDLTEGRSTRDLIFRRANDKAWLPSQQQRPLEEACRRGKIELPATFHVLRHSYASALAMAGVPIGVIAVQLGHADTRMTERHYAHLSRSYVMETVRAALPRLELVE